MSRPFSEVWPLTWLIAGAKAVPRLPELLNWLVSVVEPLIVLAITFLASYSVYWLIFAPDQGSQQSRILALVSTINADWKAGLVLLLILFYRTVRMFLEQAEEAFGVKRRRKLKVEEASPQTNPPEESV
jgi:hypothetical protein